MPKSHQINQKCNHDIMTYSGIEENTRKGMKERAESGLNYLFLHTATFNLIRILLLFHEIGWSEYGFQGLS